MPVSPPSPRAPTTSSGGASIYWTTGTGAHEVHGTIAWSAATGTVTDFRQC